MSDNIPISQFFQYNDYFIDEKVAVLKFTNAYRVYNKDGVQIGNIQQTMPGALKALSLLVNKSFFPLQLDIKDMEDNTLVTIKRGWTVFLSKIEVLDPQGKVIAFVQQKLRLLKPSFTILSPNEQEIARISGDWAAWNFAITDLGQNSLGTISKKWAGAFKEMFTTADKYVVSIDPSIGLDRKIPILATAITIDMILKESK